jgi:hypothetical protein
MAPRKPCDDGGSQLPYGSSGTSARTQPLRQLSLRQAPLLHRQPRHHTSRVPRSLRLPHWHVLRALALPPLHPHCTPGSSPYAYKRKDQGLLREGWPHGTRTGQALSWGRSPPSLAWTLVTPYCKRTRPGRGTNTKAAGFPPLSRPSPATSLSPLRARPRARPIWAGARDTLTRRLRDPPVSKRRQGGQKSVA